MSPLPLHLPSPPRCSLGPSTLTRTRAGGVHTNPRKDPTANSWVSSGVHQPSPKHPRARRPPHLGQEAMEGPWLVGLMTERGCFAGSFLPPVCGAAALCTQPWPFISAFQSTFQAQINSAAAAALPCCLA